jgi:NADPH oxidase
MFLMSVFSAHHKIRQQCYEAFWYTHHLALIFFLALYTHAVGCFVRDTPEAYSPFAGDPFWKHCIGYQGWRFTIWTFALYFLERVWREVRAQKQTEITKVVKHPYGMLRSFQDRLYIELTLPRRYGDSIQEAFNEIQIWTVHLLTGACRV